MSAINKLEDYHEASTETFYDKDGEEIKTVLAKVVDVPDFIKHIAEIRDIQNPVVIIGSDQGQNKLVISAVIKEDTDEENDVVTDFKATGCRRVLCLAKVDGIPETRSNVEKLFTSMNLSKLTKDFKVV